MYQRYVDLRDKNGITDSNVSYATGIPKSTFSDWKSGRSKPKIKKLKFSEGKTYLLIYTCM